MALLFYPSAEKPLGNILNIPPVSLYSPQSFFDSRLPFLSLLSLLFLFLVAICVAHSFLLIVYRLLRFLIALSLNLSKSVSLGLSNAYLRADSCP